MLWLKHLKVATVFLVSVFYDLCLRRHSRPEKLTSEVRVVSIFLFSDDISAVLHKYDLLAKKTPISLNEIGALYTGVIPTLSKHLADKLLTKYSLQPVKLSINHTTSWLKLTVSLTINAIEINSLH